MDGHIHRLTYKIQNKCEVVSNNDNVPSVDEIKDLVNELSEELYYTIVNISEDQ